MLVRGYAVGEATAVTPFDYSRLIYAGLFGYLIFAEIPDLWTVAGALIIVGSTIYIARREAKLKPGARPTAATFDGPAGAGSHAAAVRGHPQAAGDAWQGAARSAKAAPTAERGD
jgi:hypothetical protein